MLIYRLYIYKQLVFVNGFRGDKPDVIHREIHGFTGTESTVYPTCHSIQVCFIQVFYTGVWVASCCYLYTYLRYSVIHWYFTCVMCVTILVLYHIHLSLMCHLLYTCTCIPVYNIYLYLYTCTCILIRPPLDVYYTCTYNYQNKVGLY